MRHAAEGGDALGRLFPASPGRTLDGMRWKADLADGTSPGEPVVSVRTLTEGGRARAAIDRRACVGRGRRAPVWRLLEADLLRAAAGCSLAELAILTGASVSTLHGRARRHRELMAADAGSAELAASIFSAGLTTDWGVGCARGRDRHG